MAPSPASILATKECDYAKPGTSVPLQVRSREDGVLESSCTDICTTRHAAWCDKSRNKSFPVSVFLRGRTCIVSTYIRITLTFGECCQPLRHYYNTRDSADMLSKRRGHAVFHDSCMTLDRLLKRTERATGWIMLVSSRSLFELRLPARTLFKDALNIRLRMRQRSTAPVNMP